MAEWSHNPEPGVYRAVSNAAYHSAQPISSTGLHKCLDKSPAHYKHLRDNPVHHDYFDLGNAVHAGLLEDEYEKRVHIVPAPNWTTKAAREERDRVRQEDPEKHVLNETLAVHALGMIASVRTSAETFGFELDPYALLRAGDIECSFVSLDEPTGLTRKARPDCIVPAQRMIVDLKTSHDASPRGFSRKRRDMGYDLSAAFHLDTACAALKEDPSDWVYIWVVVEKEPPYAVGLFSASPDLLRHGRIRYRQALELVASCERRGVWTPYSLRVEELEPNQYEQALLPRQTA